MISDTDRIRFQCLDLKKTYWKKLSAFKSQRFAALRGVDLKIYDGKINALIGPSGSGKSTLARILMKLEPYDSGFIRYNGQELNQVQTRIFRKSNQILFQNPYLAVNPTFTVKRIISEPLVIARFKKPAIQQRIEELLEVVRLPDRFLKYYPSQLSGGELQRVVLARALILNPDFLILDEPLSSLDEIMAARLMKHLKQILFRFNMGILYISHHLKRIRALADVISQMDRGRIICQASADRFSIRDGQGPVPTGHS
jgi:peptide/nickel transport system ATP-binding protein